MRAQAPQDLESIHPGKGDIEHNQVESRFARKAQGGFAIVDRDRIMPGFGERGGHMPGQPDFIINNKHSHLFPREAAINVQPEQAMATEGGNDLRMGLSAIFRTREFVKTR